MSAKPEYKSPAGVVSRLRSKIKELEAGEKEDTPLSFMDRRHLISLAKDAISFLDKPAASVEFDL